MVNMLLLKTARSTLANVIEHAKYASNIGPRLNKGDILLLQQNLRTLAAGEEPIQYAMEFLRYYQDNKNESDRLWGKHWQYIIEASELWKLKHPFNLRKIQVSFKNYGQGVMSYAYVDPADIRVIMDKGYLTPA